jgi:uncharacterized protein with von Willebrand factor type A (vWA) domain
MSINAFDSIADQTQQQLFAQYETLLSASSALAEQMQQRFKQWRTETKEVLARDFPLAAQQQELDDWQQQSLAGAHNKSHLEQGIKAFGALCKATKHPPNQAFWQAQLKSSQEQDADKTAQDLQVASQLLAAQWQQVLDKARQEWESALIAEQRKQLLEQLEKILNALQQVWPLCEVLGLDPGLLFDLSEGQLSQQDWAQFQRWASYLAKDAGVRALCDLLGKVRQIELSEKIERVKISHCVDIPLPDINSREEIVGIRLGRDLEHVLPSEKALLADAETALLFDLKFVESRLMCFDMAGLQTQQRHIEQEVDRTVEEQEKRGPMVLCVDTSASMTGAPETIAKAVTLFMAAKAREEERPCYLINFSTRIQTLDLSGELGMAAIMDFLKMSFHGGTDAAPALDHALKVMKKDAYQKADLLMLSDFIMDDLPQETLAQIEMQRCNGNRLYSLVVGSAYMSQRLKTHFDHEWVYNPVTSSVHELIEFQQRLNTKKEDRMA